MRTIILLDDNLVQEAFKSIESELLLLHNDRDFEAMAAVAPLKFLDPKLWQ